jgi:carbamoyltransferase
MIILGLYGAFDWEANQSFDEHNDMTWVHDSGATLFMNGNHICSISEERLTRIKNDGNFPKNSINYCLKEGNITAEDVEQIYIPSMCLEVFYRQLNDKIIENKIKTLFPNATFKIISHHLSHAASSVFSSNFEEGSILTLDGAGSLIYDLDYKNSLQAETNLIGYFNKNKKIFRIFNGINGTNNFGSYYHDTAHKIYCKKVRKSIDAYDEKYRETWDGKIMGLSAYGKNDSVENLKEYTLSKELSYNEFPYVIFDYQKEFALKTADEQAYILQKNFENALVDYVSELKRLNYLDDNICLAGGSFLNVLGNSCLKELGLNIHIPPFTNDVGLHFGAACYGVYQNQQEVVLPKNISLLGKVYTNEDIEPELKGFDYHKFENFNEICEFTALQLAENKIIAWFQNRSEFGARALGSRSLLMSPSPKENKDIMNHRVKHREYWRPFAGIILEEHLSDYFEEDYVSPYMLYSLTVKQDKISEIAAITHEDRTCRIQTITEEYQPETTQLLRAYYQLTGIPVILNTSFNDNGEPIVETPQDAVRALNHLDIDFLVIGNYVVRKTHKNVKKRVGYN